MHLKILWHLVKYCAFHQTTSSDLIHRQWFHSEYLKYLVDMMHCPLLFQTLSSLHPDFSESCLHKPLPTSRHLLPWQNNCRQGLSNVLHTCLWYKFCYVPDVLWPSAHRSDQNTNVSDQSYTSYRCCHPRCSPSDTTVRPASWHSRCVHHRYPLSRCFLFLLQ